MFIRDSERPHSRLVKKMELSFLEFKRLMKEISDELVDSRIENVYSMDDGSIILKLKKDNDRYELRISPGRCMFLVRGEYQKPPKPSETITKLRKILNNSIIVKVELLEGERIVIFELQRPYAERLNLIIEFLPKGTLIVTDSSGRILECLEKLLMKDREIIVGKEYKPPPRRRIITSTQDVEQVLESIDKNRKIVSALAIEAGLGGRYAEEVAYIAGVEKSKKFSEISIGEYEKIRKAIMRVLEEIETGKPVIVESKLEVYPLPYLPESLKLRDLKVIQASSFNEAVRIAYEKNLTYEAARETLEKIEKEIKSLNEELENKHKTLEKLKALSSQKRSLAKFILTYSSEIEKLRYAELPGEVKIDELMVRVDKFSRKISISSSYGEVQLTLNESIAKQASRIFDEAKNIDSRIDELKREADEIGEKIKKLLNRREHLVVEKLETISAKITRGKMNWYEKYRWFYTSEGFLAVAGKDVSSNHALLRRHLEKEDLVFHSEVRGAPILILKKGADSTERSILEAAQFAACYSRAWKEGLQYISVYYVKPDQLSFSPPPGHYVPKGGVIIKGEKKYVTVKLEIAIGVEDSRLVWGPSQTLEGRTTRIIKITPGKERAKELAEEVIKRIFGEVEDRKKKELIEDIMKIIPYGRGSITKH